MGKDNVICFCIMSDLQWITLHNQVQERKCVSKINWSLHQEFISKNKHSKQPNKNIELCRVLNSWQCRFHIGSFLFAPKASLFWELKTESCGYRSLLAYVNRTMISCRLSGIAGCLPPKGNTVVMACIINSL